MRLVLLLAVSTCAFGQTAAEFEVASIKINRSGGGTRRSIEPGKITYVNLSLGEYIERAYGLKHYQIAGPDWVVNYRSENRYDVIAKAASAVPVDELLRMLVPLLNERFHLAAHRETRVVPVHALLVDKSGPKFTRGEGGPPTSYPDGNGGLIYKNVSMDALADGLSNFMGAVDGRPVLNRTGLAGSYSFTANLYGLPAGTSPGEQKQLTQQKMDTTPREENPVFAALQDQLGLKLDSQKAALEMLVIDHVERVPSGN